MKNSYKLIYIFSSMIVYVLLGIIGYYFIEEIVDIFTAKYLVHFLVYVGYLIVIDPIITYLIINKLPFKPTLTLKGDINEDLKNLK